MQNEKTIYSDEDHKCIVFSFDNEEINESFLAGNRFCKAWVKEVRKYDIETMAPQHGSVLKGDNYRQFLSWFENLECGGDLMGSIY